MERYLTKDVIAEILQVSPRTAHSYMMQMPHLIRPVRVSESSLREWIAQRTVCPGEKRAGASAKRRITAAASYRIPRRREGVSHDQRT